MRRRIVLVVSAFPKLSESFIAAKFSGLIESGWDAHVVCTASETEEWRRLAAGPSERPLRRRVHVAWAHRPRWLAALFFVPAVLKTVLRNPRASLRYLVRGGRLFGLSVLRRFYLDAEIIGLAPDLVHFEFGSLAAGRMHVGELLGCRVVVSFRGYDLNFAGLEDPSYYDAVWKRADAIHVLGEDLWRQAQRRGCPPARLHALIPPAVDVSEFEPATREDAEAGTPQRPLRVLGVGRLSWKKGYDYALEAIGRLAEKGVRCQYRIVGDGEDRSLVAFGRHQYGLEECVELLGAQPRAEVRRQLEWADVFLHAAVSEGFCNAVVEAQAMALPVVCSDAGGLPENVADGQTGFVIERRDGSALAEKLEQLARDPVLRRQMGDRGRSRVQARFRLADQISAFDRLYGAVLGGQGGAVRVSSAV